MDTIGTFFITLYLGEFDINKDSGITDLTASNFQYILLQIFIDCL